MRKIIVSMNVTLDGFMAGPNGELDWHFPLWNEEMSKYAREQLDATDTILLGRLTYQTMAGYWPTAPQDHFAQMMNEHTKIVFSASLDKVEWENSRLVAKNIVEEVSVLKRQPGKNMIIYGSGSIVQTFIRKGLIDGYLIWVHPVLIGKGTPLFKELMHQINLNLVKIRTFSSGVVILYYERLYEVE